MRRGLLIRVLLVSALAGGSSAGCASGGVTPAPASPSGMNEFVKAADASRIPVDAAQSARAREGSEAFGVALLRLLGKGDGSMVYSPQTLADLLGMILPGARGQTAGALSSALGVSGLSPDTAAAALGALDAGARADASRGGNTLEESSDVWGARDLKLTPAYLAALDGAFGTGVHRTDFLHDPAGATNAINGLVAQETQGYIRNLFKAGDIDASTLLVLTDAVYLDARWSQPFDPELTSDRPFYPGVGAAEQVPTMRQSGSFGYAVGPGWQLVELPYSGGGLAMDVLLPAKGPGTLAALRDGLTAGSLDKMLGSLRTCPVAVSLPRFTTDSDPDGLEQALSALGLGGLFGQADLGGMFDGGAQASVSRIVEKAHIQVGEQGTVAAAAAGGAVAAAAQAAVSPVTFSADHPFVYLVRDVSTGQLLFAGQLSSPTGASTS